MKNYKTDKKKQKVLKIRAVRQLIHTARIRIVRFLLMKEKQEIRWVKATQSKWMKAGTLGK